MTDRNWDFEANRPIVTPPSHPGGSHPTVPMTMGPPTRSGTPAAVWAPATPSRPGPPPVSPVSSRWGWRALASFLAGGVLTAAGFATAQLGDRSADDPPQQAASDIRAVPATADGDVGSDPATLVASLLGPSVVQIETDVGLGSGVVFADGLIVTNNHVVEGASVLAVRLPDGRLLPASVVGADPRTDIAVVAAGEGLGLTVADLAIDQQLRVGELTVAIGSPFDLQQTVTSGIVSAVNRPIFNGAGWNAMIQTDAAINPGNSGGALANRSGQVIGINTAIQTDGQSTNNAGIGFAMPISTVADIAQRIISGDSLEPGFLGVHGIEPANGHVGVEIDSVEPASAAESADLRIGDIVLSIDGVPVTDFAELAGLIQTGFPGDLVALEVVRNDEAITVEVTLGQR